MYHCPVGQTYEKPFCGVGIREVSSARVPPKLSREDLTSHRSSDSGTIWGVINDWGKMDVARDSINRLAESELGILVDEPPRSITNVPNQWGLNHLT